MKTVKLECRFQRAIAGLESWRLFPRDHCIFCGHGEYGNQTDSPGAHELDCIYMAALSKPTPPDPPITRNLSTPENRAYWKFVEDTAAEVAKWPCWMRLEPPCGICDSCVGKHENI